MYKEIFVKKLNELYEETADQKENYPYSRVKYAKFLGVTHNQVAGWLDGRSKPGIDFICLIADRHHVSLDWLMGRSEIRNTDLSTDEMLVLKIQQLKPSTREALIDLLHSL